MVHRDVATGRRRADEPVSQGSWLTADDVRVHIRLGADPNLKVPYYTFREKPMLTLATMVGSCFILLPLVFESEYMDHRYGKCPILFWAAYHLDTYCCKILIESGADVHWQNPKSKQTAFDMAKTQGAGPRLLRILSLTAGADSPQRRTVVPGAILAELVSMKDALPVALLPVAVPVESIPMGDLVLEPDQGEAAVPAAPLSDGNAGRG